MGAKFSNAWIQLEKFHPAKRFQFIGCSNLWKQRRTLQVMRFQFQVLCPYFIRIHIFIHILTFSSDKSSIEVKQRSLNLNSFMIKYIFAMIWTRSENKRCFRNQHSIQFIKKCFSILKLSFTCRSTFLFMFWAASRHWWRLSPLGMTKDQQKIPFLHMIMLMIYQHDRLLTLALR